MILLDLLLLWVEYVVTMITLIKREYFDYRKDLEERERWFSIIPEIIDTANIVVWERHWAQSFESLIYYGKETALSVIFIRLC